MQAWVVFVSHSNKVLLHSASEAQKPGDVLHAFSDSLQNCQPEHWLFDEHWGSPLTHPDIKKIDAIRKRASKLFPDIQTHLDSDLVLTTF